MPFALNVVYPVLTGVGRCCWNRWQAFTGFANVQKLLSA
ncbi:hypothetical protein FB106_11818 [Synechococcus sp. Ace-Pa]|nr:hypothetical protein FB106_11818 [Synechococcus sp. Ace-Pa]